MCSIFIEELKRSAREIGAKCGGATSAGWSLPLLLLCSSLCSTLYCFVLTIYSQCTDYVLTYFDYVLPIYRPGSTNILTMCYHVMTMTYEYTDVVITM